MDERVKFDLQISNLPDKLAQDFLSHIAQIVKYEVIHLHLYHIISC